MDKTKYYHIHTASKIMTVVTQSPSNDHSLSINGSMYMKGHHVTKRIPTTCAGR